jgi:hypothetical protein
MANISVARLKRLKFSLKSKALVKQNTASLNVQTAEAPGVFFS